MNIQCELDFFTKDTRKEKSYIDFHSHNGYELVYYASGHGRTTIGDKVYPYQAGQFSVIEPNCPHDEYRESATEVHFLVFSYNNYPIALRNHVYTEPGDAPIKQLMHKLGEEMLRKNSFSPILLRCYLTELIVEIGKISGEKLQHAELEDQLLYAKSYIEQYAPDKINLPKLAETHGYSYDYFRHLFKENTGYSPMQYIMLHRFKKAKQLLAESRESITTIALECGFSNTPQFCAMFKKQFGVSPLQYKGTISNKNS